MSGRHDRHPLEGVVMKILIKPPKIDALPSYVFKKDLPQSLKEDYDFSLETEVLKQAAKRQTVEPTLSTLQPIKPVSIARDPYSEELLLPQSSTSTKNTEEEESNKPNMSFKEFESDAFSPFDHVEMQTLNDLEELHLIFGTLSSSQNAQKHI